MPIANMTWNILWSSTGTRTLEMNFGAQKAVGQVSLGQADGAGLCNSGIRGFRTRPSSTGAEQVTDFGDNFYNWPNTVFDEHLSGVTFAIALGSGQEGTAVCNIFQWS
ncbi:hypothetical protein G9272_06610 [Streptomyces asoensis]|uniref:Uncharacterized protein n=1 Tax=Streptomyces asoensis TaxID=249586 RepID=A0A6M4WHW4_9ACTN|nr:hypothetical protein [Streptomyces asoensis]QJS99993.1 hypothetical protein G9272_06610 [Streptomyces asoensis]